ncbi:sensor histidine kinase [Streptomyces apocyni]|uniref:sensor histidine kinase n=1 Tax=Streptomyces apocyni TaxID=2654677 RepID=UPI001E5CBA64|nr:histidine kinase [Streptomyces apocyni]
MDQPAAAAPPTRADRVIAALTREPLTAPHARRNDAWIAAAMAAIAVVLALTAQDGRSLDALGWTLLLASTVPLVWRRQRPLLALVLVVLIVAPYHGQDYQHVAAVPAAMFALYTVAATGTVLRSALVGVAVVAVVGLIMVKNGGSKEIVELLRISGWMVAVLAFGADVRIYRRYVRAVVERAERAERTREEEAARRVAEERLRIARDLHDLLAHSITLIGVQTSVASHVLTVDPDRLDRAAISRALDDISETCRTARGELRTTLEVLRADGTDSGNGKGPLPALDGLADLAATARTAGAKVDLSMEVDEAPPAVGAAAYRIVQEALTNAVRHAGPEVAIDVGVRARGGALTVTVTDDGSGGNGNSHPNSHPSGGFGLVGMRERARSVAGTLHAGPRPGAAGFAVTAVLPLTVPVLEETR